MTKIPKRVWLPRISSGLNLALMAVLAMPVAALQTSDIVAVRDSVADELVASLPADLSAGPMAVLAPELPDSRAAVASEVADGWVAALSEALDRSRPDISRVSRERLEDVLREQKFGDSASADPDTAVEVGRLVAARYLLLTHIREFRTDGGPVRVVLESQVVDVETGRELWSRSVNRGIFPRWLLVLGALVVVAVGLLLLAWRRGRAKTALFTEKVPRAREEARVDVDALARSAATALDRSRQSASPEVSAALSRAWNDLDSALEKVRHGLPGGRLNHDAVRDAKGARKEVESLARTLQDLTRRCASEAPERLTETFRQAAADVSSAVDAYRHFLR